MAAARVALAVGVATAAEETRAADGDEQHATRPPLELLPGLFEDVPEQAALRLAVQHAVGQAVEHAVEQAPRLPHRAILV